MFLHFSGIFMVPVKLTLTYLIQFAIPGFFAILIFLDPILFPKVVFLGMSPSDVIDATCV